MSKTTRNNLSAVLEAHKLWLEGRGGVCANLAGADLGVKSPTARMLRILGACMPACEWVDGQASTRGLLAKARKAHPAWMVWLTERLGGDPTAARLRAVAEYITAGVKGRGF